MPCSAALIVELIGTPGAGKTTLANELVNLLRARGFAADTILGAARDHAGRTRVGWPIARLRSERLRRALLWQLFNALGVLHAVSFCRAHPAFAREVLATQLRRRIPMRLRRHALFWFLHLAGRHRLLSTTARPGEALVVDDGFLHRSVALNASHTEEVDPARVARYVALLPRPDLVVSVVAGRDVCERRVRARGVWLHRRDLSAGELSRYLANAERAASVAVDAARARGWIVVDVDNDDRPLERVVQDLEDALWSVVPAASPHTRRELKEAG